MKYFKTHIAIIISLCLLCIGCTEEETYVGYALEQENEIILLEGTVTTTTPRNAQGRDLEITVTIPKSFSSDADVEVTGTLKTGVQSIATITIPAGSTTAIGSISVPSDEAASKFGGIQRFFSVELTAILLGKLEPDTDYTIKSDVLEIDLFDTFQHPDYTADLVDGRMTYLFDWANPDINDLNVYVSDLEIAESGDRYEADIFDDTHPDGTYTIETTAFIATDTHIAWKLFFVYPDQTTFEIFEGTISDIVVGEYYPLVQFTKSTNQDTGIVTYTNVTAL